MHDIIQLLPDSIANQIAAGEVVQRPASVVKELIENAIDAQATDIRLVIKDAGKQLIQVIDNGIGMSPTDARMCFERHATSKISNSQDLFNIRTMGFRGEAMASIAAVAQVELRSKRASEETGILITIEASVLKKQEETASNQGTSISVKNLFFNVPARRNFLKKNSVEMRHILNEFQRTALAHPECSFAFKSDDNQIYQLHEGKLIRRIMGLFDKKYKDQIIPVQEDNELIKIHGYLGTPKAAKRSRGEQFFFVNKRFIKSGYLHHAVVSAMEHLIPKDQHPFYVLFLEIDPKHIDINVHPTKTEIKFDDEKTIYAILNAAIRKAIATFNLTPTIDFGHDVNILSDQSLGSTIQQEKYNPKLPTAQQKSNLENWQKLYDGFQKEIPDQTTAQKELFPKKMTLKSKLDEWDETPKSHKGTTTMLLNQRYILHQSQNGLMIIDPVLAHQRILYDKYISILSSQKGVSQSLLFPSTIVLNTADYVLVRDLEKDLRALGFLFEYQKDTDQKSIILQGIPAGLKCDSEQEMLQSFIEQYKMHQPDLTIQKHEKIARALAKKTAIKAPTKLEEQEIHALLAQLFASQNPSYTPSGEPTLVLLDMNMIGQMFV